MLTRGLSPAAALSKRLAAAILAMVGLCGPLAAQGTQESLSGARSPALARVFAAWKARQGASNRSTLSGTCTPFCPRASALQMCAGLAGLRPGNIAFDKDVEFTILQSEWSGEGLDRVRSDLSELTYNGADGWKETGRFRFIQNGFLASRLQVPKVSDQTPTISLWRKVPIKQSSNWFSSGDLLLEKLDHDLTPLRSLCALEFSFRLVAGELPGHQRGRSRRQRALHPPPDGQSRSLGAVLDRSEPGLQRDSLGATTFRTGAAQCCDREPAGC